MFVQAYKLTESFGSAVMVVQNVTRIKLYHNLLLQL